MKRAVSLFVLVLITTIILLVCAIYSHPQAREQSPLGSWTHPQYTPTICHFTQQPRVAYITSIMGTYERTCKPFVPQTVASDFICFTNNPNLTPNAWTIDTTPYHEQYPNHQDHGNHRNSLKANKHTFNIAKYYKQSFKNIPRMKEYDVVVWLDGTLEITYPRLTEYILQKFESSLHLIAFAHEYRPDGSLKGEVAASHFERYTSTRWNGQDQPYQDVDAQFKDYLDNGFQDGNGVWITCFIPMDMRKPETRQFLDAWYLETLRHTTQDQISFPYVLQKAGVRIHTLPDDEIKGKPHNKTDFYIKHDHGK